MTFRTVFETSTYLLLLVGFTAVAVAGAVGPVAMTAFLALLVSSLFLGPFRIGRMWALAFVAVGLLVFTLDLFAAGDAAGAAVRLLLLLGMFKVFTRDRDGDYLLIYLLSFALLLVSSTFNMSVGYLVMLVMFVFLAVLTLVLFESRKAYAENPRALFSFSSYLQVSAVITLLTSVLAIPIFLAVPRGSLGLFSDPSSRLSGFSTTVRLGDLGRILDNPEVFMRVAVDRPLEELPPNIRWRGIALDRFDGRAWSNTSRHWEEHSPDAQGRFMLARQRRFDEVLLQQTFYVEPYTEMFFGAPSIVQLSGLQNRSAHVMIDENESVLMRPRPADSSRYYVHSDLLSRGERIRRIEPGPIPDEIVERFLSLPELDPRIVQLTHEVAGQNSSAIQKAFLLEDFFRRGQFQYSLRDPSGNTNDPLADFLLNRREGHCEYYATALAVMFRIEGIPSRLVNGFRRGEYNGWGDYFIVRQSDAHSWVEAYFPGAGWVDFDSTPAVRLNAGNYLLDVTGRLFDTLDLLWTQVVTFDRIKQFGFFQLMRESLEARWEGMRNTVRKLSGSRLPPISTAGYFLKSRMFQGLGAVFVLSLVSLLLYRYRRLLRRTWSRAIRRRIDVQVAEDYYLELLEILRRKGYSKRNSETPLEFCRRVGADTGSAAPEQIVLLYYRSRFGNLHLQPAELGWLDQWLGLLRTNRL